MATLTTTKTHFRSAKCRSFISHSDFCIIAIRQRMSSVESAKEMKKMKNHYSRKSDRCGRCEPFNQQMQVSVPLCQQCVCDDWVNTATTMLLLCGITMSSTHVGIETFKRSVSDLCLRMDDTVANDRFASIYSYAFILWRIFTIVASSGDVLMRCNHICLYIVCSPFVSNETIFSSI